MLIMLVLSWSVRPQETHTPLQRGFYKLDDKVTADQQAIYYCEKPLFSSVNFADSMYSQSKENSSKVNISLEAFIMNLLLWSPSATAHRNMIGPING